MTNKENSSEMIKITTDSVFIRYISKEDYEKEVLLKEIEELQGVGCGC